MRRLAPLMAVAVAAISFECVVAIADEGRPIFVAHSPWMKFCLKSGKTDFKTTCFTGNEVRSEADHSFVATVAIIELEDGKRTLRVTFPLGMQVAHGTRLIIDREDPQRSPYVICFTSGCMSDYDASSAMIDIMKRGQVLVVQAIDTAGAPLTVQLPLTDFAAAYDGPPSDPGRVETLRSKPKPWLDDTLAPRLQPRRN
jgi:invasion protein IalB